MANPSVNPKHLVFLAVAEGLVFTSAVLRLALFPGQVDLGRQSDLFWLIGIVALAGAGVALFVIRSAAISAREKTGEDVSGQRMQALGFSLSMVALAGLVSALGPGVLARLLGG